MYRVPLLFLLLLLLLSVLGCARDVAPAPPPIGSLPTPLVVAPENAEVASFNARVAELELELSQASTPNDDNETIKENLRRYGEAVAESADPILAEPDASVALRRRAAEVKFSVTVRRLAFDPGFRGPARRIV